MMQRLFPLIPFLYFIVILFMTVFFLHPIFLGISFLFGLWYCAILKGKKVISFGLFSFVLMGLIVVLNPLLNHRGVTILGYLWNNPITWESIFYGICTALMTGNVIIWSICFQSILTGDKIMAVFGKVFPTLTLIFTMTLATIPKLTAQNKKIKEAQRGMRQKKSLVSAMQRYSVLLTWALENGIDTADSMSMRGYGSKKRTHYSRFVFTKRDGVVSVMLLILWVILMFGLTQGSNQIYFFPYLEFNLFFGTQFIYYINYAAFCSVPVLLHYKEVNAWYLAKT